MFGIGRLKKERIELCERRGVLCDTACRAEAIRDQGLVRGVVTGWRLA